MAFSIPKSIDNALGAEYSRLSRVIDNAVRISFRTADLECGGNPGEVDKVLSFFLEALELIESEFNRILQRHGIQVSIAAIFTHQTPMVEFPVPTNDRKCELADVCMLATYNEPLQFGGLGNGILLQAKNEFDSAVSEIQRELYERVQEFDYYRPRALVNAAPGPPPRRNLPAKSFPGLAYWELNHRSIDRWPFYRSTSILWASHVSYGTTRRYSFGSSLLDFLRGAAGYGFSRPAATEHGWSRIVYDLLTVTAEALVNRRALNVRGMSRGSGPVIRELLLQLHARAPAPVLNSLPEILSFYSDDLGTLGQEIVRRAEKGLSRDRIPKANQNGEDNGKPPILGNNRESQEDDNGGAGNIVLFHFSQQS